MTLFYMKGWSPLAAFKEVLETKKDPIIEMYMHVRHQLYPLRTSLLQGIYSTTK
jgi:hypothetical protein